MGCSKMIKLKKLLKKEGIEFGKVYTDKDMPPFKVNEEEELLESANPLKVRKAVDFMIKTLRKQARKLNDDEYYEVTVQLKKWYNKNVMEEYEGINEADINLFQGYSSKEAKKVIDDGLKLWAKDLRKVQYRVVKDWMSKAKSGVIDYFDLVRGLKTGDIRRAHTYETDFLFGLLNKDKIVDTFRRYFGGNKGKKRGIKR